MSPADVPVGQLGTAPLSQWSSVRRLPENLQRWDQSQLRGAPTPVVADRDVC